MSNTKLPALPPHPAIRDGITWRDDERKAIDEYARAAILADRERQAGEAVALTDEALTEIYRKANGEDVGKAQPLTTQRIFRAMRAVASLPAPQAVLAGWKQIGWTCDEGACGRIHDEPSTADPEFTQPVFVRAAAPSPDGKAEQAEAPSERAVLEAVNKALDEQGVKGGLARRHLEDRVLYHLRATQPTASIPATASRPEFVSLEEHDRILQAVRQPTASNAGEREE